MYSVENSLKELVGGNWTKVDEASGWAGFQSNFSKREGNILIAFFKQFNVPHELQELENDYVVSVTGSTANNLSGLSYLSQNGETLQEAARAKAKGTKSDNYYRGM